MATDSFRQSSKELSKEILDFLKQDLRSLIGKEAIEKHFPALRRTVIQPAIKLGETMGCSGETYLISVPPVNPLLAVHNAVLWNVDTWSQVTRTELSENLHCLFPGLIRRREFGLDGEVLVRPFVVGFLATDLKPRAPSRSKPTSSKRDGTPPSRRDTPSTSKHRKHSESRCELRTDEREDGKSKSGGSRRESTGRRFAKLAVLTS